MELATVDKKRKLLFAKFGIGLSLPVIFGFLIVDFIEGEPVETILNVMTGSFVIAGAIAIRKTELHMAAYRSVLMALSLSFFYNVIIGSGEGTAIYWLFPFPLMFMFFLDKKEGGLASIAFFCVLCILLINPFSFDIYAYPIGTSLRFLVALLLVILMAFGLETSRDKFGKMMLAEHQKLIEEKQNLQQALERIKTLSGLIPICSKCKKIRDDKGYWQQVEVYVRDHSSAEFSHGLCPECYDELYGKYDFLKKN